MPRSLPRSSSGAAIGVTMRDTRSRTLCTGNGRRLGVAGRASRRSEDREGAQGVPACATPCASFARAPGTGHHAGSSAKARPAEAPCSSDIASHRNRGRHTHPHNRLPCTTVSGWLLRICRRSCGTSWRTKGRGRTCERGGRALQSNDRLRSWMESTRAHSAWQGGRDATTRIPEGAGARGRTTDPRTRTANPPNCFRSERAATLEGRP